MICYFGRSFFYVTQFLLPLIQCLEETQEAMKTHINSDSSACVIIRSPDEFLVVSSGTSQNL